MDRDGDRLILAEGSWKFKLAMLLPASFLTTVAAMSAGAFLNGGFPRPEPGTPRMAGVFVSLLFLAILVVFPLCWAIRLALLRCRYTIVPGEGTVTRRLEFLGGCLREWRYSLTLFEEVRCVRAGRDGSRRTLSLVGPPWQLNLVQARSEKAIDLAEQVAQATGLTFRRD